MYLTDVVIIHDGLYCSMSTPPSATDFTSQFFVFAFLEGLPLLVGVGTSLVGYILAIRMINEMNDIYICKLNIKVYRLLWYPAVLFATFVPCSVDSLTNIITQADTGIVLKALHLLLAHSVGLTNALLYGLQRKMYHVSHQDDFDTTGPEIDRSSGFSEEYNDSNEDELRKELGTAFS